MYRYEIIREEYISGSLKDFRALMHEILELQPLFGEDKIFLQGECTPSTYPENMGRWEVTLGGTLQQRGFIIARQLPNRTTKLQFAYYSKFESIGPQFDIEFIDYIMKQSAYGVELAAEEHASDQADRIKLYQNLIQHFNLEELRTLSFKLGIQDDNFPNQRDSFARELVTHCGRRERLEELIAICQRERPQVTWQ